MITQPFTKAAESRARALGMPAHPVVVIDHPIASKDEAQMQELARNTVDRIARSLTGAES